MDEASGRGKIDIDIDLLHSLFASTDQAFCLCEAILDEAGQPCDYQFLSVNALFERMTGLVGAEGRRALDLVPDLEPYWVETYGRVAIERRTARFRNEAKPLGRWFDVLAAPVDPEHRFVLVFRDVTEEVRTAAARDRAESEAAALLDELNHRVMNSLGMIAAIIGLEARGREQGEGRRALERIGARVHAVADLYRALSFANLSTEVRADDYLGRVINRLSASVGGPGTRIEATIEAVELPTQTAVPLGLVLNEILTARLRAGPAADPLADRQLRVSLEREAGSLHVSVIDTGDGSEQVDALDGAGKRLLDAFVQQLGGRIIEERIDGTVTTLSFPIPRGAH